MFTLLQEISSPSDIIPWNIIKTIILSILASPCFKISEKASKIMIKPIYKFLSSFSRSNHNIDLKKT